MNVFRSRKEIVVLIRNYKNYLHLIESFNNIRSSSVSMLFFIFKYQFFFQFLNDTVNLFGRDLSSVFTLFFLIF